MLRFAVQKELFERSGAHASYADLYAVLNDAVSRQQQEPTSVAA
jgi:hypothetical protein